MVREKSHGSPKTGIKGISRVVLVATAVAMSLAGSALGNSPAYLGVQAGPTWGSLSGQGVVGWTSTAGYRFGLTVECIPERGFGFETAVYVAKERVRRAVGETLGDPDRDLEQRLSLGRMEFCPASLRYHFPTNGSVKPFIAATPIVGLNFYNSLRTESWNEVDSSVASSHRNSDQNFDFGIALDGGLGFRTDGGSFTIGARDYYGLMESIRGCVTCSTGHYGPKGRLSSTRVYMNYAIRL